MADLGRETLLFVGLGNPGRRYRKTRHNLGFLAVERFAERKGWQFKPESSLVADCAKGLVGERMILLAKPQTYMNLSGDAVQRVMRYYRLPLSALVVVADDVALPLGQLRLRLKGSAGGHNGLKSVETSLGTSLYKRLKLGVQSEGIKTMPLEAYVLSPWTSEEERSVEELIDSAASALEKLATSEPERVMNEINRTEFPDEGEENNNEPKPEKPL